MRPEQAMCGGARGSHPARGQGGHGALRAQDAHEGLAAFDGEADLVFKDHEKVLYEAALEPSVRALRVGGLLIADNTTSHEDAVAGFCTAALAHAKLTAHIVTLGRGQLLAVKVRS